MIILALGRRQQGPGRNCLQEGKPGDKLSFRVGVERAYTRPGADGINRRVVEGGVADAAFNLAEKWGD